MNTSLSIGLFGIGLDTYWPQFPGLQQRLEGYLEVVQEKLSAYCPHIVNAGLVDSIDKAFEAGRRFKQEDVGLIFLYVTTYALSSTVLPVVQKAKVPVIILNLSPEAAIDYAAFNAMDNRTAMTGEWLAYCSACTVPEIANVFNRTGIKFHQVTGILHNDPPCWQLISEWIEAAKAAHTMFYNRLGCMGHYYSGMLDIYTDLAKQYAFFGGHIELLEVEELAALRKDVTSAAKKERLQLFYQEFDVQSDCSLEELEKAAITSVALDQLVSAHKLGSMAYYYKGTGNPDNEEAISSIILGNSLLTARGIPVAGEYEIKNVQAMKIMDSFGAGGSFTEYYAMDYKEDVVLMGHDGPGHIAIAEGKTKVRPLKVYHGKVGKGVSVEMMVKNGPVTLLSVIEQQDKLMLLVAEGESVPGPILQIGNTNSRYKFSIGARKFVNDWNAHGPAHHCAIGVGHIHKKIEKLGQLLNMEVIKVCVFLLAIIYCAQPFQASAQSSITSFTTLQKNFQHPPASARPGVYWYFMDGNISKEAMTADLESMRRAGIGSVVFLEVNVGVPRGPVTFFSEQWQELFVHAVREAERLGIEIVLGTGPGWAGSGGPWVKASNSMQHLVASETQVKGPGKQQVQLELPKPKKPYFGYGTLTPTLREEWNQFYKDVTVLAYPTPDSGARIEDIDEKAFYYRAPYTSAKNVKPYLPSLENYDPVAAKRSIPKQNIIDLTNKLQPDGTLNWDVPAGNWTILRFVTRNNGAVTRPAPEPGLGFEADKFDTTAMGLHLDHYVGSLLKKTGTPSPSQKGGLKRLHIDSWEMGAQNWTPLFRDEFEKRRGYDPLPFYPVYLGNIVENREISERFLWDLRQTSQELIIENHAGYVKAYGKRYGLTLSIEPYDMNPAADLELGAVADVPMCEFWSKGFGFNSAFSCIEGTSVGHVNGASVIPAEAFTAQNNEGWKQHPGSIKAQGDWAFATGINQLVYHTFQHQCLDSSLRPGMTMGPYGVHWDRNQTWWPFSATYHRYVARSQFLLQQGRTVADIVYLTPEGAPHVFRAPTSALFGNDTLPDRKGFNFDGCAPGQLYKATVKNNRIVFPGGASYSILVLPATKTMTPRLLQKIAGLVKEGATVVGTLPPVRSPGLSGYPACDVEVKKLATMLWGTSSLQTQTITNTYGKGKLHSGGDLLAVKGELYPAYEPVAALLRKMKIMEDVLSDTALRYTHRQTPDADIYFVANRTGQPIETKAGFRITGYVPQLWDAITGEIHQLPEYEVKGQHTFIPLQFTPHQSFFIIFPKHPNRSFSYKYTRYKNFPSYQPITSLEGSWQVSFDTAWGGPATVTFNDLQDWITRPESGIKYYSGKAVYRKQFDSPLPQKLPGKEQRYFLELGDVKNMAVVTLNGHTLDTLWTAPWRVEITRNVKMKNNILEVTVVNLWSNRLIGDEQLPDDGINNREWPAWLRQSQKRTSGRYTFTTSKQYAKDSPLLPSGLLGPVKIVKIVE